MLKWTWEELFSVWHLCPSASSVLNRTTGRAWAFTWSQKHAAPSSAFEAESLFAFRFAPVSNVAGGMKAEDELVCFCDSRGCFMVLNVADRTGPEPSPGTRTSLQVTSRVDSTVKMMLHKQPTKHILPAFEVQYVVQFFVLLSCFSFLYLYNALAITKDVNTKRRYWKIKSLYVNHMQRHILDVEGQNRADPDSLLKENRLRSSVNAWHMCTCAFMCTRERAC